MSKNLFTDEQVEQLLMNHYVRHASKTTVSFTEEFKRLFYQKRQQGYLVNQIFVECGIDPGILGEKRSEGFCYTINNQCGFIALYKGSSGRKLEHKPRPENETDAEKLRRLEHEVAYTRQEIEFKKNSNGRYGGSETMGIQAPAEVKFSIIYEAIKSDDNLLNISYMCRIAGVSRSGFYAWMAAAPAREACETMIKQISSSSLKHTTSEDMPRVQKGST